MKKLLGILLCYVVVFLMVLFAGVLKGPKDIHLVFKFSLVLTLILGTVAAIIFVVRSA